MLKLITEQYKDKISGVLSCYDRVVITGTLPEICYSQGITSYLYRKEIRIFDYPKFAEPFRETIRENAEHIAKQAGIEIEFISKSHIRKEEVVAQVLNKRGNHPGLVHIISAMESCPSYKPWHDKTTGKTFLKGTQSKCLHYYFYLMDEQLGLCYVRVPTWCPFRLQIYFNGHHLLASQLDKEGIGYTMIDNAFDSIDDWGKAQQLSDNLNIDHLHKKLDEFADKFCPVYKHFDQQYHWSIMQCEYATDIVFKNQKHLQAIYDDLVATAIHTVKPDNIATFLGQKLDSRYTGEMGNNYNIRIEGSRIKHNMGHNSIKMYDKFNKILRIETTTNKVSFFKHYRKVEHRNGTSSMQLAGLKKNIYSLAPLKEHLMAANRRYLEFISAIENKNNGRKRLEKITQPKVENNRKYKGFNLFDPREMALLSVILRGEFNINGFRNKNIRERIVGLSSNQVSRLMKRLKLHGLIKKVANSYKYYMTRLGKELLLIGEKIKQMVIIPALNY